MQVTGFITVINTMQKLSQLLISVFSSLADTTTPNNAPNKCARALIKCITTSYLLEKVSESEYINHKQLFYILFLIVGILFAS
jgi:hypothetical protein